MLEIKGYQIEEIPVQERPYLFYKHKDGRIVRLPADPYSLKYYLSKGLVVVPENKPKKRGRPKKGD
jgi:hypothetical protein